MLGKLQWNGDFGLEMLKLITDLWIQNFYHP